VVNVTLRRISKIKFVNVRKATWQGQLHWIQRWSTIVVSSAAFLIVSNINKYTHTVITNVRAKRDLTAKRRRGACLIEYFVDFDGCNSKSLAEWIDADKIEIRSQHLIHEFEQRQLHVAKSQPKGRSYYSY
jgi:hypothetical protein